MAEKGQRTLFAGLSCGGIPDRYLYRNDWPGVANCLFSSPHGGCHKRFAYCPQWVRKTDIATARLLAQLWICLALFYLITAITLSRPVSSAALAASFSDLQYQRTCTTAGVIHRFQRCKHNAAGPDGPHADTASSHPTRTPIRTLRYHQYHHGGAHENIDAIVVSFDPGHLLLAGPCHLVTPERLTGYASCEVVVKIEQTQRVC